MAKFLDNEGYNTVEGTEVESYLFARYKNQVETIEYVQEKFDRTNDAKKQWVYFKHSIIRSMLLFLKNSSISNEKSKEFFDLYRNKTNDSTSFAIIAKDIMDDYPNSITEEYIDAKIKEIEENDYVI